MGACRQRVYEIKKMPPFKTVFICSAGRSGSTLLDLILGSHSQITSLGEITQLPKNLALNTACACGVKVRECAFWAEVISAADRLGLHNILDNPYGLDLGFIDARVVIDKSHQSLVYNCRRTIVLGAVWLKWRYGAKLLTVAEKGFSAKIHNNLVLFDAVRQSTEKPIVVDSSKHYLKAIGLYKADPQDTLIVVLTRDGRGVYHSNRRQGFSRKRSLDAWRLHFARTLALLEKTVPKENTLFVKYEDLCESPATVVQRICSRIGLEFEKRMLDFAEHEHHIANGNDMRFGNSSEIKCDETWREALDADDLRYFGRHAWHLNRQLGYGE